MPQDGTLFSVAPTAQHDAAAAAMSVDRGAAEKRLLDQGSGSALASHAKKSMVSSTEAPAENIGESSIILPSYTKKR